MVFVTILLLVATVNLWALIRERPMLPGRPWWALAALRALGILFLALVLWQLDPWALLAPRSQPVVHLIVDGSRSMGRSDGLAETRFSQALQTARLVEAGAPQAGYRMLFGLDSNLASGLTNPAGRSTDIAGWLATSMETKPDAIVLLSDGNNTAAGDPAAMAASAGVPVYTIGFGPAAGSAGPAIVDAWCDEQVRRGQEAAVRVHLRTGPAKARLSVRDDGEALFDLPVAANRDSTWTHAFRPTRDGIHRLTALLLIGRDTAEQRTMVLQVRRDKLRVVYLSQAPDWNLRFLQQAVAADPEIRFTPIILGPKPESGAGGRIPAGDGQGQPEADFDVAILHRIEPGGAAAELAASIGDMAVRQGKGLLLLGSGWDGRHRQSRLAQLFPLRIPTGQGLVQRTIEPTSGSWAGLLSDDVGGENALRSFSRMPMLAMPKTSTATSNAVTIVAQGRTDKASAQPVWAWWYRGQGKVMELATDDLWSWKLAAAGAGRDTVLYQQLVLGILRWLGGVESGMAAAGPERSFYFTGEEVRFRGHYISSDTGKDASRKWKLSLSSGPGGRSQVMAHWGRGEYQAVFKDLGPGNYRYTCELTDGLRVLDRRSGVFWIEPSSAEDQGLVQNTGLLQAMARASGGEYRDGQTLAKDSRWLKEIKASPRATAGARGQLLFGLAAMAAFLAEWFLRRRWGLK